MSIAHSKNPFSLKPIETKEQFFGRKQETRRALEFLHHEQCISVAGQSGIGKTSFLCHVANPDTRAEHRLAEEQIFIYVDSHALANHDQGECYLYIREQIIRRIKSTISLDKVVGLRLEQAVREASSQTAYFGLQTLFRTAQANSLRLIVLLDDFELLARSSCLDDTFFSGLRSLPTNYQMAYLVASRSSLYELERVRPAASPFFNIFQTITLGPLTPAESREFIVTFLKRSYVKLPEFAIDHILELGNNKPSHLQRAGYITFQVWQENGGNLQMEHCEKIRRRFEARES